MLFFKSPQMAIPSKIRQSLEAFACMCVYFFSSSSLLKQRKNKSTKADGERNKSRMMMMAEERRIRWKRGRNQGGIWEKRNMHFLILFFVWRFWSSNFFLNYCLYCLTIKVVSHHIISHRITKILINIIWLHSKVV